MAPNLAWRDLSLNQLSTFYSLKTTSEATEFLTSTFKIDCKNEKDQILLDFYYHLLRFAMENKFNPEQTSAFFSLAKKTHEHCTSTPFINFEKDYAFCKQLILEHSIYRPPYSTRIFSFEQVSEISDYLTATYFRHYLMYKYCFTKKTIMELKISPFAFKSAEEPNIDVVKEISSLPSSPEAVQKVSENGASAAFDEFKMSREGTAPSAEVPSTAPTNTNPATAPSSSDSGSNATNLLIPPSPKDMSKPVTPDVTSVVVDSKSLVSEPRGIDDAVPVSAATMAVTTNTHPVTATPIVNNNSQLTPHQQATIDLRQYILSTLAVKMDDLKSQMSSKISAQEEVIQSRLKSLEGMLSGTTAGAGDEALANDKASAKTKKDLKKK